MAKIRGRKSAITSTDNRAPSGSLADVSTTMIASEVVLRSVGRLARRTVEKAIARRRADPGKAKSMVENRGLLHTAAAFGASRIATKSIPGALLVGGGLLAKALFDQGSKKRKSRKTPQAADDSRA